MIYYKTPEEIEHIRVSCRLVASTLATLAAEIKPGSTTLQLDKIAYEYISDHKSVPAFLDYRGFPNSICASLNEAVVHGIPNDEPLKEGDVVSIDCGVILNEFFGDSAFTFALKGVSNDTADLLRTTRASLLAGIEKARRGSRMGDVSAAIQDVAEKPGYGVVRELVGHGLGRALHESPEVPNYGRRGRGIKLKEGLVIAIEPMVNRGTRQVKVLEDQWTVVTGDGKPSAHYEHTIAITGDGPDILSDFEIIDSAIRKNPELEDLSS